MVDFVCEMKEGFGLSLQCRVGVSVTRILQIGSVTSLTEEELYYLLLRKLATLIIARSNVSSSDEWHGKEAL